MAAEMIQLSLFPETKEERLLKEFERLKEQSERSRKAQFAKIAAHTKLINELNHEMEILKSALCNGSNLSTKLLSM